MNYRDKTLIRGESLYLKVTLYSENSVTGKLEKYDAQELTSILESTKNNELPKMVAEARLADGRRIPLTIIQELDDGVAVDGALSLYSDVDTWNLPGESFDVNIVLKKQMDLGFRDDNDEVVMKDVKSATFNETFYIERSATDLREEPQEVCQCGNGGGGGHSVVYLLNGQFYACENYNEGDTINPVTPTVRDGYVFSGWGNAPSVMPDHCVVFMGKELPGRYSQGLLFEDIDENTCRCIGRGQCTDSEIIIPSTHEGKTVVDVGGEKHSITNQTVLGDFEDDHLISLYLPDTIRNIGYRCFCGCESLSSIRFPENEEFRVGIFAFYGNAFETLTIPANFKAGSRDLVISRTQSGTNIFGHNNLLRSVVFEEGFNFDYILDSNGNIPPASSPCLNGQYMFSQCDNLSSVSIPTTIDKIPQGIFSYCNSLTEIRFTSSVISDMEERAFTDKSNSIMTHVYFACKNAPGVRYRVGEAYSPVTFHYDGSGIGWDAFKTNMERLSTTWGAAIVWVDESQGE